MTAKQDPNPQEPDQVHQIKPTTYAGSGLLPLQTYAVTLALCGDRLCTKRAISFNAVSDPVVTLLDGGEFHRKKQAKEKALLYEFLHWKSQARLHRSSTMLPESL